LAALDGRGDEVAQLLADLGLVRREERDRQQRADHAAGALHFVGAPTVRYGAGRDPRCRRLGSGAQPGDQARRAAALRSISVFAGAREVKARSSRPASGRSKRSGYTQELAQPESAPASTRAAAVPDRRCDRGARVAAGRVPAIVGTAAAAALDRRYFDQVSFRPVMRPNTAWPGPCALASAMK
jgi:hypothetical protein